MPRKEILLDSIFNKSGPFYERKDENTIQCNVCPHHCQLRKGMAGVCGVRYHTDHDTIKLLNYGKAIAYAVDPMEKKPLYHFYPGRPILSIGTLGCNFRCKNCQNYDIS